MKMKLLLHMSINLFVLTGCGFNASEDRAFSFDNRFSLNIKIEESGEEMQNIEQNSLIEAVEENNIQKVRKILEGTSFNINEVNQDNESALLIATHNNYIDIAKVLIDFGADVNQQDNISDSPYLFAGAQGKTEILSYILENSAPNQSVFNRFGGNALIPAAEKGHLENVKLLLRDGNVDIDLQNKYGYTALIESVALSDGSKVYQDIVKELRKYNANLYLKDNSGRTALDYADMRGYTEIKSILST